MSQSDESTREKPLVLFAPRGPLMANLLLRKWQLGEIDLLMITMEGVDPKYEVDATDRNAPANHATS